MAPPPPKPPDANPHVVDNAAGWCSQKNSPERKMSKKASNQPGKGNKTLHMGITIAEVSRSVKEMRLKPIPRVPPPPPELPDAGPFAVVPPQPTLSAAVEFGTATKSRANKSPMSFTGKDRTLLKEKGRGSKLVFGKMGQIIDLMGLAQYGDSTWVPNKRTHYLPEGSNLQVRENSFKPPLQVQRLSRQTLFQMRATIMKSLKQLRPKTTNSNKRNTGSMEKHRLGMGLQSVPLMRREPMLQIRREKNGYLATANERYFLTHKAQVEDMETLPDTGMLLCLSTQNVVLLSEPVIKGKAQDIKKETSVPKRNGVVMLQGIVEDAAVDILEASSGLAFFLVRTVIDDVVIHLSLKESDSRLSLIGIGSLTLWMVQLLKAGLASYRQWDPGKRDLVFNDYCTRRIFGGCCYGALENPSVVAAVSVLMSMSSLSGDLEVLHVWVPYFCGNWKGRLWKKLHGRKSSIRRANFPSSDLRTSLFFKRVAMLGPQMRVWAQVGLAYQLPNTILTWQRGMGHVCDGVRFSVI